MRGPSFQSRSRCLSAPAIGWPPETRRTSHFRTCLRKPFYCKADSETSAEETRQLEAAGVCMERAHMVDSDGDLAALVEANIGVALAPKSALRGGGFVRHMTPNLDLRRTVTLYTVQGRARSAEAGAFIAQIRAHVWEDVVA